MSSSNDKAGKDRGLARHVEMKTPLCSLYGGHWWNTRYGGHWWNTRDVDVWR
jgi:hypothetical protein